MVTEVVGGTRSAERQHRRSAVPRVRVLSPLPWQTALVAVDAVGGALAAGLGLLAEHADRTTTVHADFVTGVPMAPLGLALPLVWIGILWSRGVYGARLLPPGLEQSRRVISSGVWLLAGIVFLAFLTRANLSRAFVVVTVPTVIASSVTVRLLMRSSLQHRMARGRCFHGVIAIGSENEVADLVEHMHRRNAGGLRIVGAWVPGHAGTVELPDGIAGCDGGIDGVVEAAALLDADTIAVAGSHRFSNWRLRELAWRLEGTRLKLVVVPAMTDLAGPRVRVRPVDGLPLLQVERPQFTGLSRIVKTMEDLSGSALLLVVSLPVTVILALAIKVTSRGPVIFRQTRVGLNGREFTLFKFRTMTVPENRRYELVGHTANGDSPPPPYFKLHSHPCVTTVGRALRRTSLDELPQLWNVLRGEMSLVGPRPQQPFEVAQYGERLRRRLLVKPGMTGLWQVSGRSDLPVDEAARLDLYYIENWSVGLDLSLLCRTVGSMFSGRGAY